MNRSDWSKPISTDAAYRRAGGRARYNMQRGDASFTRRQGLARMLGGYAPTRGELASVARRLGVSKATASRDVARLKRLGLLQERMTFKRLMQQYRAGLI